MSKYLKQEHGYWRIFGDLKNFLLECRAKESTRYAINGINIAENLMASTDGQRLAEVAFEHKIEQGNYFCTDDGWLLSSLEGNFPKYKEIFPKKQISKKVIEFNSYEGSKSIGRIFGGLYSVGFIFDYALMKRPIEILSKIISGKVKVFVALKNPGERPFYIEAETEIGNIRYIQMPIIVS